MFMKLYYTSKYKPHAMMSYLYNNKTAKQCIILNNIGTYHVCVETEFLAHTL